jgi:hypothetical protein
MPLGNVPRPGPVVPIPTDIRFAQGSFIPADDRILLRAGAADGWDCR